MGDRAITPHGNGSARRVSAESGQKLQEVACPDGPPVSASPLGLAPLRHTPDVAAVRALPAGWLGLRAWRQTGPLAGSAVGLSAKAAVWTGAVRDRRLRTRASLGRALPGAALSLPLVPTGLALRRHGRIHRGLRESHLRAVEVAFRLIARGLVNGHTSRLAEDPELRALRLAARVRTPLVRRRLRVCAGCYRPSASLRSPHHLRAGVGF